MQVATFVIAVAGFGLAVASLVWQIVSWLYTGGRVSVETELGHTVYQDGTMKDSLFVIARNKGRSPVELRNWGFLLPDDRVLDVTGRDLWTGPDAPLTLDGLHAETWAVDLEPFKRSLAEHMGRSVRLRGFVDLGTGKRLSSKNDYEVRMNERENGEP